MPRSRQSGSCSRAQQKSPTSSVGAATQRDHRHPPGSQKRVVARTRRSARGQAGSLRNPAEMSLCEVLQVNCSGGSPRQDRAAWGELRWPFRRDEKVLGATPRSSPSRSTTTLIASGTHASVVVSGSKSLANLCVPASAAWGSRTSEHDAAVSGKSLETYVGMLLLSKLVAGSQARLSQLCSFHDEFCVVTAGGWGARITRAMFLCRCVTGDSTVRTESLLLTACRREGRNESF